ncbi:hypothetical protein [Micromonospora sp. 4G55]|uniref:hypothetical protein n=1 Tax=Micromonospora sp. 4G55 TaxID=2806102 RepID=UPI001A46D67A|nr:hypothetical protein [Micromonospora sp. 4G55]MBM0259761.1 hypothetical protein [Micromonospora sp. 4G55]
MSNVSVEISGDGGDGSVRITGGENALVPRAGMRVHDPNGAGSVAHEGHVYGPTKVEIGELSDGDYGIAVVNEAGKLVKLEDFIFGPQKAKKTTVGQTSSTSYTNLSDGVGPAISSVKIGELGRAIVTLTAYMEPPPGGMALMGVEVKRTDGSFAIAPDDFDSLSIGGGDATQLIAVNGRSSVTVFIEGLFPGTYNFTAKYRVEVWNGQSAVFANRVITVQPY